MGIIIFMVIPITLFEDPYATVVNDSQGELLSASIADDGQWRFPEIDSISKQFADAVLMYEDEYFNYHPGVNPVSLFRAFVQNIKAGKVVSGGSTISMQVVRLIRKNRKRTYWEKLLEIILAVKLDLQYSKDEILRMYVSHAPYGGNVVGVQAASWRYYSRPLHLLSQAEYALLAVLPNAPSLMHPGKNRDALLKKRNSLLHKMFRKELFDSVSYSLSLMEAVPEKPSLLPNDAFHLLNYAKENGFGGQTIQSSIEKPLQKSVASIVDNYIKVLSQNEIRNACAMVVSLEDMTVRAYVGNTRNPTSGARYVDIIQSPRSSGSILKPFLYGKAIDAGLIHSSTLLRDVPVCIDKFSPSNFDERYEGVVPVGDALARSLNIPAALLLRDYGIVPFYEDLNNFGFSSINRSAGNYGLTLILGGAEVTLWDLARIYAHQAKALGEIIDDNPKIEGIRIFNDEQFAIPQSAVSEGAWWLVSDALTNVQRPDLDQTWKMFSSSRKIAWKTGTSHGFRDAWAVGYDAGFVVAVWVGNAEGDGRPGLTGVSTAAPLMFNVFQRLPKQTWYSKPEISLKFVNLCKESGMLPGSYCPTIEAEIPIEATLSTMCDLHKKIQLNNSGLRVTQNCETGEIKDTVWFCLDPVASYYYKQTHQQYKVIPPFKTGCGHEFENPLAIIYPHPNADIIIPKDFDGKHQQVIFEAAHTSHSKALYWHLDRDFIGTTQNEHILAVNVNLGEHTLLIMDEDGNKAEVNFEAFR